MTEFLLQVGWETWLILKEASFFLLLGFVLAGVLAVLVPSSLLMRLLGKGKVTSVLWASAIGTPLPLCSCGVVPTGLGLLRQGATKGATVSFLISTPEIGVDSIALTYALMDPIMAVFRPIAAFVTAFCAGIATNLWGTKRTPPEPPESLDGRAANPEPSSDPVTPEPQIPLSPLPDREPHPAGRAARFRRIFIYAFRDLLDEISHWLVFGIVLAALVSVLLPVSVIERYLGGGLTTMLAMLVIGVPLYICASAATPLAATLILKGMNPGAALVFLLSGPATNLGTIVLLLKFLGRRVVAIYLTSMAILSLVAGYALNWIYQVWQVSPAATFGTASGFVPEQVKLASALLLLGLLLMSLWRTPVPAEWLRVREWWVALTGIRVTAGGLRIALAGAVGFLYVTSGVYTVQVGEIGIRTRFGRIVDGNVEPGLHYRLPWPIEGHRVLARDRVRRIEVGFRSAPRRDTVDREFARQGLTLAGPGNPVPTPGSTGFWYRNEKVSEESFLLTGDENIIDIAFTVQYRVRDPIAYIYNVVDPDAVVRHTTVAALRALVATMTVDAIYTTERGDVERRAAVAVQVLLDAWNVGVHVVAVNLLSVHAPEEVHAAFRDVASAQEDKILIIERATTFALESVNLAEGDAAAMIESALAFKEQRILEADGDAIAFGLREKKYRRAPDLTRFRLHLEALEEILPATQRILRPGRGDVKEFDLWLLQPFGKRGQ